MNRAKTARWVTRMVGLGMIVVGLLVFRVMERQLRRIGQSAEARQRAEATPPPPPPSSSLPRPRPPAEAVEEFDSKRGAPSQDPFEAARDEALPTPGVIPEGAVW